MRRGHLEVEFQAEGGDVVFSWRSSDGHGSMRVSRPGLRAIAALAERAAMARSSEDDYEARCEVRGEVIT
ncbi:MAG: hypothetical protein KF718_16880 [Polyangiaceae bacterium]|nr:hypothetical protein [Polyangiaceae bacterium]